MFKKLTLVFTLFASLLFLAACSSNKDNTSKAQWDAIQKKARSKLQHLEHSILNHFMIKKQ